ncbi:hypothetical protein CDL12_16245 [Handroanthus impetiginosus]|uniref:Uncharacterized protein n=1 Tax=Handroanthus impetiginosus TaxID=429701 RepID=A0A2G9H0W1_9LAMI|nr:hypothetical protein CDL12_16245 [Handroanthus impetiginosus]
MTFYILSEGTWVDGHGSEFVVPPPVWFMYIFLNSGVVLSTWFSLINGRIMLVFFHLQCHDIDVCSAMVNS